MHFTYVCSSGKDLGCKSLYNEGIISSLCIANKLNEWKVNILM